jgi:hypothetical protein
MKTLKLMLLTAGMAFLTLSPASAQQAKIITSDQEGWRKIAETTVDFDKDKDVLMVFGKDRFRKLQFMVMDAPIEITNMIVYYEGGTRDTINVSSRIEEGGRSRVIDLEGSKPEIGRIVFNYKTSKENWITSSTLSTDATMRSASTRKTTTGVDDGTTVTTGTGTENERKSTTGTDNTSNYGNSNTITGAENDNTKVGSTDKNVNKTKHLGESKENNSTKARVILWGLK